MKRREKLSVTLITYNEETNIQEALESVRWADEIIVLDSFSPDRTLEICKKYTDKIISHEFVG
ncbi:MAG TPA: glycosyltransferase, partial [Nitrospiria bacterium]|nr:glycosyltransferase [Nitrospiria bacterium]